MSRNINRAATDKTRKTRRRNSILFSIAIIAVIIVLLVLEQVALLYLVATLGVAVLLIIVALSDLHGATPAPAVALSGDDSAAIADGITSAAPVTSIGATRPRASKRKRR